MRQLGAAWRSYQKKYSDSITPKAKYSYANRFHRGYLFGDLDAVAAAPEEWPRERLGSLALACSPALERVSVSDEQTGCRVLLLGTAISSEADLDNSRGVAGDVLRTLSRKGLNGVDSRIEELGGRFVLICRDEENCRIFVDPMASLTAYYAKTDKRLAVSSHSALIAAAVGEYDSDEKAWVMQHPDYVSGGGKYLPGLVFPHDVCLTVFANHSLDISLRNFRKSQRRVYPRAGLPNLSVDEATDVFIDETRFHLESWLKQSKQSYLALTAGRDSRALLSVGLDLLQDYDATCMTYHFFEKNNTSTFKDLLKANQLAEMANLTFKIVNIPTALTGKGMGKLYNTTFPTWARFPTLASAFYHQLVADANLVIGIGGGIGTGFFRKRESKSITPEVLARKFSNSDIQYDPKMLKLMADYAEFTEFSEDKIKGFNFYDLFHWEHRLSKWASIGYSEYDLSVSTALPMNSRRMIEAMLSVPEAHQFDKSIYEEIQMRSTVS